MSRRRMAVVIRRCRPPVEAKGVVKLSELSVKRR
jgi:hypothetical protein